MSPVEVVASLLIVINVALVARRSIWNYAFGIAGVALYGWVFFGAKLYSDALLQVFFLVLQFYGWWNWQHSQASAGDVVVARLTPAARWAWCAGIVAASLVWGCLVGGIASIFSAAVRGGED